MTKSRNLDFELFRKHLNKMIGIEGINQEEIKEATGLSNVSRYLSGKRIVNPKMRTWFLIHDAFPELWNLTPKKRGYVPDCGPRPF